MNFRFLAVLFALAAPAAAAPATRLSSEEWVLPLESPGVVLVDAISGQTRIGLSDSAGQMTWKTTVRTVEDVTGVAGGLAGIHGELVALASPYSNRIVLLESQSPEPRISEINPPPHAGPKILAEIGPAGARELFSTATLENPSGDMLDVTGLPVSGGVPLASTSGFPSVTALQPLYETTAGPRIAAGTVTVSSQTIVFLSRRDGGTINATGEYMLPGSWKIASCVKGTDGRTLVVAYQPGQQQIRLFTLSGGIGQNSALTQTGTPSVSFASGVGSLIAVGVPGAINGMLATSYDGTQAAWIRVVHGSSLSTQGTFLPSQSGRRINSLIPLPGVGVMRFETEVGNGPSTHFSSLIRNGTTWDIADSGLLPPLLPPQTDFATIFYFDSEPFIDDNATLLGLQVAPDWTNGSAGTPFPANIPRETYISASAGLGNPAPQIVNAPATAQFLVGNQPRPSLSLSAAGPDDRLLRPSLEVRPAAGTFPSTIEVSALFDSERNTLRYRRDGAGGSWADWPGSLPVSYTSAWLFHLKDRVTGASGPIVRRSWTIDPASLNATDSDGDGVPDYVETALGLDPFGGADSDGDGVSDLEEILAGSDPADPNSVPATRAPVPQGDGMHWWATAYNQTTGQISNGETITANDLAGALVAAAEVADHTHPTLGTERVADLVSVSTLGSRQLVALSTPVYFNLGTGINPPRNGRETIRLTDVPTPVTPTVATTPSGTNLTTDANQWIAAAKIAYAGYHPVSEITEIRPKHTIAALLAEAMIYDCLVERGLFDGPPPAIDNFTIFPARPQDAARTPFSRSQIVALSAQGFDFSVLRELVETAVDDAGAVSLRTAVNAVYARHVSLSVSQRGPFTPFAALRVWVETGVLPAPLGTAVSGATLTQSNATIAAIRARCGEAFRPLESWLVKIVAEGSQPAGVVRRTNDSSLVALLKPTGEAFGFERGIGVREGSQTTVSGFTDVSSPTGHPAMEVTAAVFGFLPVESARDSDCNLLDDEWELFFFGAIGNDPHSSPPGSDFTLLEHYFAGTDPRGGDDPSGQPLDLTPPVVRIEPVPGGYELLFEWPALYASNIVFGVNASPDLSPNSFAPLPGATVTHLGSGNFRATLPPIPPGQTRHFYRITMALP